MCETKFPIQVTFRLESKSQTAVFMDALEAMEKDLKKVRSKTTLEALQAVKKTMEVKPLGVPSDDET